MSTSFVANCVERYNMADTSSTSAGYRPYHGGRSEIWGSDLCYDYEMGRSTSTTQASHQQFNNHMGSHLTADGAPGLLVTSLSHPHPLQSQHRLSSSSCSTSMHSSTARGVTENNLFMTPMQNGNNNCMIDQSMMTTSSTPATSNMLGPDTVTSSAVSNLFGMTSGGHGAGVQDQLGGAPFGTFGTALLMGGKRRSDEMEEPALKRMRIGDVNPIQMQFS
ncbi:unnamed protein product [Amoebophrya sp. A25]|nr:unnamed protein product [Amoebophrya sp. A25]|eukprot:GSA25T00018820001.1